MCKWINKLNNRKAFTIVELVIVIAVIAILATVLVPTFGNVINNAKDSAAKQEARNAYTEYVVDAAASGAMGQYYVYQADEGRFVAIDSGSAVGVFATQNEALEAMVGAVDADKIFDTANDKLFVYGAEPASPGGDSGNGGNGEGSGEPEEPGTPNEPDEPDTNAPAWDTDGDGEFAFLAIGNSFSVDALEYVYQIAQDVGIEKIAIGNLYIGGCSLNTHATNAKNDAAAYTYYFNDSGSWETNNSYKINTALQSRKWDFVMLQQVSNDSGNADTYNGDLTYLIDYVKQKSDAKLVWHMTWAYQQDSTHNAFSNYNKNQMTMYNAIVSAVQSKIVTNGKFDLIVPNGTAVQNSRTSILGDTTTRDGYHMSNDYGRYLTGLMVVKTVTGLPVDDVAYRPTGVDELEQRIAIDAVNKAAATPFAVTKSAYTADDFDSSDYTLLEVDWQNHAYWWSSSDNENNKLAGYYKKMFAEGGAHGQTNCARYFTNKMLLTREDLPVGSIIVVADGWQYRPEGWRGDYANTKENRPQPTSQKMVVVTEEWWGDYILRAFNVYPSTGNVADNFSQNDMDKVIRIYVPKDNQESADSSDYELLDINWYLHGFWNSSDKEKHSELINKDNNKDTNHPNYFTTPYRLTRENLPVGSIIVVENGWQYRPDGWVTSDTVNNNRPGNTQDQFVVVTEEWWGDYTLRAFNVSKIAGSSVTQAELDAGKLKIYVPKN